MSTKKKQPLELNAELLSTPRGVDILTEEEKRAEAEAEAKPEPEAES